MEPNFELRRRKGVVITTTALRLRPFLDAWMGMSAVVNKLTTCSSRGSCHHDTWSTNSWKFLIRSLRFSIVLQARKESKCSKHSSGSGNSYSHCSRQYATVYICVPAGMPCSASSASRSAVSSSRDPQYRNNPGRSIS
jgi:hypothetical protein